MIYTKLLFQIKLIYLYVNSLISIIKIITIVKYNSLLFFYEYTYYAFYYVSYIFYYDFIYCDFSKLIRFFNNKASLSVYYLYILAF